MNDNEMIINGTVNEVTEVSAPFEATKVGYTTTNGKETTALFGSKYRTKEIQEVLGNLEAGDLVKVVLKKNDKGFFNPSTISKLSALPAPKASGGGKTFQNTGNKTTTAYDSTGPIKGNAITNAVQLAIARHGNKVDLEDLKSAFDEIIELHTYAETKDINTLLHPKTESKSKKTDSPF